MFEEKLRQRNQQSDIEDCNRYYNLMKEQENMMEKNKQFDEEFIYFSRQEYLTNDERAKIKREINSIT